MMAATLKTRRRREPPRSQSLTARATALLTGASAIRTPFVAALGIAMVLGIGVLDVVTGPDVSFSIVYLLPVSLVAFMAGRRAAIGISLAAAATWLVADLVMGPRYSNSVIHYWNAGVRLGFFLIVTLLLSALRQSSHRDHGRRLALEAVNEVAHGILSGRPTDEVVRLITGHARALLDAALAIVATTEVSGKLLVRAADGVHAEELEGLVFDEDDSPSAEAMRTRSPVTLADAAADPRTHVPLVRVRDIGPAVFVPLTVAGRCFGTLSIGRLRGGRHFSEDDLMLVQAFATEAGVALEYGEIRNDLERLAVLEERQHIAKDLYEWVGQSLFAVGMLLQAAGAREDGPATRRRLTEAVEEIDRMMAELRRYVLDLSPSLPISTTPELP